jgi:hypothetical protein
MRDTRIAWTAPIAGAALALCLVLGASTSWAGEGLLDEDTLKKRAEKTVGPEKYDNNCSTCHASEYEAWKQTRHYATIKDRHRSAEAKAILGKLGQKSMKRAGDCRQCHYTSIVKPNGKVSATWGVTCESCHGPAKDWNDFHNKVGGDPSGKTIAWGSGKTESPAERKARIGKAEGLGMIHPDLIYDIATNCYGCHTVPNEELVNKGGHKPGSEIELVTWSQGEVRHSFSSSSGAPDNPTNREASAEQRRRLYIVGQLVDLEYSLRNVAKATDKSGQFDAAMVVRVNAARGRVDAILAKVSLPGVAKAVGAIPKNLTAETAVDTGLADALGAAARKFVQTNDGSGLGAIDGLIPTELRGTPHAG